MPSKKIRSAGQRSKSGSKERVVSKMSRKQSVIRNVSASALDEDDGTQVEDGGTMRKQTKMKPEVHRLQIDSKVTLTQLRKFCLQTIQGGVNALVQQFSEIKASTAVCPPKTAFDANTSKNRYRDVPCIDKTRIQLKWPPGAESDYIHANWVDFMDTKKFICTQGPTEATVDDFWRLVWQEKCKAIVMLCELMEQGRRKCEAYWPAEQNQSMPSGESGLTIRNVNVTHLENTMTVTQLEVSLGDEKLTVKHIKWNKWPDHGVPEHNMAPFRLLRRINHIEPVLIHCSAGIGRTGTIVALYMAIHVMSQGKELSLQNVVKELRSNRHGSVQTNVQYVYIHRSLINLAENKHVLSVADGMSKFIAEYDEFIKWRGV